MSLYKIDSIVFCVSCKKWHNNYCDVLQIGDFFVYLFQLVGEFHPSHQMAKPFALKMMMMMMMSVYVCFILSLAPSLCSPLNSA